MVVEVSSTDEIELREIKMWFAEQGFGLKLTGEEEDLVWAELTRMETDDVVVPMYGRGSDCLSAARRAKQRFEQEQ